MLTLTEPSSARLAAMVERARSAALHDPPGHLHRVEAWLAGQAQPFDADGDWTTRWRDGGRRWYVDRHTEIVGHGEADFERACDSLRAWAKFRQPWTRPAMPLAPIETGATVGYSARFLGVWWSYCCRIIDVFDRVEPDGRRRFGLDYATLRGHAERGEERFAVTFDPGSGEVRFTLFAVSRPGRWYTIAGRPLARAAQRKFRPGATAAVAAFVRSTPA